MQKFTTPVLLAYCAENQALADKIEHDLSPVINFRKIAVGRDQEKSLTALTAEVSGPIILLVSDNFLRSTKCMEKGLSMLNAHRQDILPVVIPGFRLLENGEQEIIQTSFERVTDIIQYINFWQDRYLDLRRQKREDPSLDNEGFLSHLKIVRDISGEAGEYIRLLRAGLHLHLYEFEVNAYEQLFLFLDEVELGASFRSRFESTPAAATDSQDEVAPTSTEEAIVSDEMEDMPPVDLSSIPGIAQIEELETPAEEQEEVEEAEEIVADTVEDELPRPVEETPTPAPPALEQTETEVADEEEEALEEEQEEEVKQEADTAILVEKAWRLVDNEATADAIRLLEVGLDQYAEDEQLIYNYALLLAEENRLEEAAEQVSRLLTINPHQEDGLFLAGELADQSGNPDLAQKYFSNLARLNDRQADVWYRLGTTSLKTETPNTNESVRYFKEAVKREDCPTDAFYQLGLLHANALGRPKKAKKYFNQTIELEPEHPFANYDLALLYHHGGEHEKAYQAYQQAISINPEIKTPENDTVFKLMAHKSDLEQEQTTLQALKHNIERLEALIQQREETTLLESEAGKGKCVLITGATSGIGKATADKFAVNGFRLVITGRRKDRLQAMQEQWATDYGTESHILSFDVTKPKEVTKAINSLPEAWSSIDILINNAGKAKGFAPIHEGELDHWEEMIDTNIKGLLYLTRALSPKMVEREKGHIINVASTAGKEVYPNGNVYCATKFAVDALTKSMRLDLHQYGVRVSQVAPAHVEETEFAMVRFDGDEKKANIYEGFKPLSSKDVAETIYFISQQPAHVNILDVVLQGTQQASSMIIDRSGRDRFKEEE